MKQVLKKNQFILTLLALMIAAAGYLTYTGNSSGSVYTSAEDTYTNNITENGELLELSEEEIMQENLALEQAKAQEESESASESNSESDSASVSDSSVSETGDAQTDQSQPGDTVLTNATDVVDYMAEARLSREQLRSKNQESLNELINNMEITDAQKQSAVESLVKMSEYTEMENSIETLLSSRGFENVLVTVDEEEVDVIVGLSSITEAQKAQIEDAVKRKADVSAEQIVISLMEQN